MKQANSLESDAIAMLLAEKFFLITELVLHQVPKCMWALIGLAVSCQVVARSMVSKSIPHSVIMLLIDSSEARLFNALKSLSALHLES